MKDEVNGSIITHFVVLVAKRYLFLIERQQLMEKSKDIKYNVGKNVITFIDYVYCLRERCRMFLLNATFVFTKCIQC